jgi:hypothetical protein
LSGFYKDVAPPALGPDGFETHANGRKKFEPVSHRYSISNYYFL